METGTVCAKPSIHPPSYKAKRGSCSRVFAGIFRGRSLVGRVTVAVPAAFPPPFKEVLPSPESRQIIDRKVRSPTDDLSKCVLQAMEWLSRDVSTGARSKRRREKSERNGALKVDVFAVGEDIGRSAMREPCGGIGAHLLLLHLRGGVRGDNLCDKLLQGDSFRGDFAERRTNARMANGRSPLPRHSNYVLSHLTTSSRESLQWEMSFFLCARKARRQHVAK